MAALHADSELGLYIVTAFLYTLYHSVNCVVGFVFGDAAMLVGDDIHPALSVPPGATSPVTFDVLILPFELRLFVAAEVLEQYIFLTWVPVP